MQYTELMDGLYKLPTDIESTELRIAELRKTIKDYKAQLEARQTAIALSREAKAWGSNEEERKLNKSQAFATDAECKTLTKDITMRENDVTAEEVSLTRDKNLFYAFRSMAELHAAYLLSGRSVAANGNGNAIADEMGL
jgi:hypothetical protein